MLTDKPPAPLAAEPDAPARRSRGAPKGIRITDVAATAGVSPITVSRVFNAPESVAPDTLLRVRQAVQQLGYVPNRLAGGPAADSCGTSQRGRNFLQFGPARARRCCGGAARALIDRLNGDARRTVIDVGFEIIERETL